MLLRRVGVDADPRHVRSLAHAFYPVVLQARDASRALAIAYYQAQRERVTVSAFRPAAAPHYEPAALEKELQRTLVTPAAETNTAAMIVRHVEQAGRESIVETARADSAARRWQRMPRPGHRSCAWCTMLISRGPVYNVPDFAAHDNCGCIAVPVFAGQREWDGRDAYENARKLWKESTAGKSGKDALNAFRRAHDSAKG